MGVKIGFLFSDYRIFFFSLALLFYAFWGAPTADHPGWVDGIIFMLLLLSVKIKYFLKPFDFKADNNKERWFFYAQGFLIFGVCVPTIISLLNGVGETYVIRDLIGFLFLILPLFLYHFLKDQKSFRMLLVLCLIIGFVFSLRTLFPDNIFNIRGNELLYLANSPLVLFSSIFLAGYGGQKLFKKITLKNMVILIVLLAAALICLLAMMQDTRRAAFVAVIISLALFVLVAFFKKPVRAFYPLIFMAILVAAFWPDITLILEQISLKTSQVGLNMRVQEWQAVWGSVEGHWSTLLFGKGWGAAFESPAVGGFSVTFTHSLLSAILLKTGMIGLLLCLLYLAFIFEKLARLVFSNPIAGFALFWPFFIAVLFYASYKSLDFGLLLTLILIWYKSVEPQSDYE